HDALPIYHIITNLLSNAIKYATAGTPVSIDIRHAGDYTECAVSNQGTLVASPDSDTLFQRYFRGDNAKGHTGIGIGLYMARALARLQGGDVRQDSGTDGT